MVIRISPTPQESSTWKLKYFQDVNRPDWILLRGYFTGLKHFHYPDNRQTRDPELRVLLEMFRGRFNPPSSTWNPQRTPEQHFLDFV